MTFKKPSSPQDPTSSSKITQEYQDLDTPWHDQVKCLVTNVTSGLIKWSKNNKTSLSITVIILVLLSVLFRALWQPVFLTIRINLFPILLGILLLGFSGFLLSLKRYWLGIPALLLTLGSIVTFIATDGAPRKYLALFGHYQSLNKTNIDILPLTEYERIQPLNSIRALAKEALSEVEHASEPGYIREANEYMWSMGVEPSYTISRMLKTVSEVISVSATAPSPNFSSSSRSKVSFITGENLLFSRNSRVSAINRLGILKYWNYEPAEVHYIRNDKGEWVQAISMIHWKGFIFPRPVFGGVFIINQKELNPSTWLKNSLFGSGTWIPAYKIKDHSYLLGQNIMPVEASRYDAESFRFQNGFAAPLPGYHIGDIRIPDIPGDYNDQPYACYFKFESTEKLFHYFALEPYQADKQGLNTSLFIPADGVGPVRVFKHHEKGDALTGVSAIPNKVMESRKNYDWTRNIPAEQKPYIRDIDGIRRFSWLTTVVTFKNNSTDEAEGIVSKEPNTKDFFAGSVPDVTLTDALYKAVVWVDARKPDDWENQLNEELKQVWGTD